MTTYNWLENGQSLGTTSVPTLDVTAPVIPDAFVPTQVQYGADVNSAPTNTVFVDVYPPIKGTLNSAGQQYTAAMTSGANLNFQWSISTDGQNWSAIAGSGSSITLNDPNATVIKTNITDPASQLLSLQKNINVRSFINVPFASPTSDRILMAKTTDAFWTLESGLDLWAANNGLNPAYISVIRKYPLNWKVNSGPTSEFSRDSVYDDLMLSIGISIQYSDVYGIYPVGADLYISCGPQGTFVISGTTITHHPSLLDWGAVGNFMGIAEDGKFYFHLTWVNSTVVGSVSCCDLNSSTLQVIHQDGNYEGLQNLVWNYEVENNRLPSQLGNKYPLTLGHTNVNGGPNDEVVLYVTAGGVLNQYTLPNEADTAILECIVSYNATTSHHEVTIVTRSLDWVYLSKIRTFDTTDVTSTPIRVFDFKNGGVYNSYSALWMYNYYYSLIDENSRHVFPMMSTPISGGGYVNTPGLGCHVYTLNPTPLVETFEYLAGSLNDPNSMPLYSSFAETGFVYEVPLIFNMEINGAKIYNATDWDVNAEIKFNSSFRDSEDPNLAFSCLSFEVLANESLSYNLEWAAWMSDGVFVDPSMRLGVYIYNAKGELHSRTIYTTSNSGVPSVGTAAATVPISVAGTYFLRVAQIWDSEWGGFSGIFGIGVSLALTLPAQSITVNYGPPIAVAAELIGDNVNNPTDQILTDWGALGTVSFASNLWDGGVGRKHLEAVDSNGTTIRGYTILLTTAVTIKLSTLWDMVWEGGSAIDPTKRVGLYIVNDDNGEVVATKLLTPTGSMTGSSIDPMNSTMNLHPPAVGWELWPGKDEWTLNLPAGYYILYSVFITDSPIVFNSQINRVSITASTVEDYTLTPSADFARRIGPDYSWEFSTDHLSWVGTGRSSGNSNGSGFIYAKLQYSTVWLDLLSDMKYDLWAGAALVYDHKYDGQEIKRFNIDGSCYPGQNMRFLNDGSYIDVDYAGYPETIGPTKESITSLFEWDPTNLPGQMAGEVVLYINPTPATFSYLFFHLTNVTLTLTGELIWPNLVDESYETTIINTVLNHSNIGFEDVYNYNTGFISREYHNKYAYFVGDILVSSDECTYKIDASYWRQLG